MYKPSAHLYQYFLDLSRRLVLLLPYQKETGNSDSKSLSETIDGDFEIILQK